MPKLEALSFLRSTQESIERFILEADEAGNKFQILLHQTGSSLISLKLFEIDKKSLYFRTASGEKIFVGWKEKSVGDIILPAELKTKHKKLCKKLAKRLTKKGLVMREIDESFSFTRPLR